MAAVDFRDISSVWPHAIAHAGRAGLFLGAFIVFAVAAALPGRTEQTAAAPFSDASAVTETDVGLSPSSWQTTVVATSAAEPVIPTRMADGGDLSGSVARFSAGGELTTAATDRRLPRPPAPPIEPSTRRATAFTGPAAAAIAGIGAAFFGTLLLDLGVLALAFLAGGIGRRRATPEKPSAERTECQVLLDQSQALWRRAEAAVLRLEDAAPLRSLLLKELSVVTERLSIAANPAASGRGALVTSTPNEYYVLLRQRLRRTARDLNRIAATAEAALATLGNRNQAPTTPKSRMEALLVLGANHDVDDETLKRLVRALRQCWHPDLARDDEDRAYRDARIAQINVAYDILTGRRGAD